MLLGLGLIGCVSPRVLRLESDLTRLQNEALTRQVAELEAGAGCPEDFVRNPSLDDVEAYLDRAGYVYHRAPDDKFVRLEYAGRNTSFGVRVQLFEPQKVLFLSTTSYLRLEEATDSGSVIALLVQLAALNYELLLGKFQLDPESGEILLSLELPLNDGVGYGSFVRMLDQITRTADERFIQLKRAVSGHGL
ncbi:MAG: YbjN domain-containing protein [Deltaproteobacteria bacterium]|nr:MAG: YbjN domain-containing protein [Deltaproteobacteria bacterium]